MKEKKLQIYVHYLFIRCGMDKIHLLAINRVKTPLSGFPDLLSWFLFAHAERRAAVRTRLAGMSVISSGGG